jgi:VWFA-related protein
VAYASVVDRDGKPVTDMTAADFDVREGGKPVEIAVKPATTPLRLALIVSDRGTGIFQVASLRLLQPLTGKGEFSIIGVVNQPETVATYTSDGGALSDALGKIGKRGQSRDGAQTLEALVEVADKIRKDGTRPVIVLMRIGGEPATGVTAKSVRDRLLRNGITFYAMSIAGSMKPSSTEGAVELEQVLGDGTRERGGRHAVIAVTAVAGAAEAIAAELANQYEISYTLPDGVKPSDRLQVTSKRKNVTVLAPNRIPN